MRGERELYREKIEVSLDGKQVFYLFFGAAVVACLVFVLGVMVGRRLESRAHADAVESSEAASDPLAALDLLAAGDGADNLSFPEKLTGDEPDTPPAPPAIAADPEDAEEKAPEEAKEEPPEEAKEEAPEEPKAEPKQEAVEAKWTLQLSSFQDEDEATTFYEKLRSAGYSPTITRAEVPDKGTWFRVRVGRYPDYDSAIAAKAEFEKREQIIAYVTRL